MLQSRHLQLGLLAVLAACGSDPSGPSTGSLAVAVTGLPAGTSAAVTVTGPGTYTHELGASETLSGLAPGGYTVRAQSVIKNGQSYQPDQALQSVSVGPSGTPASAQVAYSIPGATLTVTVAGLPPGTNAAVEVTGPAGYDHAVTATATLANLSPGVYTVTAQSISAGGTAYNPSPGTQSVNLAAAGSGSANVSYTSASAAGLNLRIDGMYLTQSVQRYTGGVPLVADRDGFLRVFVTASQANVAMPQVRVRFYHAGALAAEQTITAPGLSVPLSPNEASLSASWNVPVPRSLIQPDLSVLAEVDPGNTVAESDETDNAFPVSGSPLDLDVRATSTFTVRFVPIVQSANGRQGNVTNANMDSFLVGAMKIHPLAAYDADLRAPYTTTAPAVTSDNGNGAWTTILNELAAIQASDGSARHYFGVINPSYGSGVAGIGYVGGKTAVGWDKNGADMVAAHEWGHNWNRKHAPCGDAPNPDNGYPYAGGTIGVFGFDVAAQSLKPPSSSDLMGYCSNEWISDYTYMAVLGYRAAQPDVAASFAQARQPCLLVWGRVVDGRAVLEPAFQIVTRPLLPAAPGSSSIEGRAADGTPLFHLSFTPEEVADDPRAGEQFAFAVPLPAGRAVRLDAVRLSVPGRPAVSIRAAPSEPAPKVEITRAGPGRVALQWDASAHPVLMVRDPASGQVLSFARGGRSEVATDRAELEVQPSSGLGGRPLRVAVPGR